ncbi:hypothetical protein K458DRAFT_467414 [Lentithecium fluviatile CBS 122367]|uniref:RapZ C-terminal domain-containing protein n=1 Tax=Lentithecium fluviatile CBS 122367 TaxID=1168545 RepID=A0A6G1JBD6_9PLEO|nr:hypothetical protein K458DRAFT_467414 [Lentithecium fluviatile CBS 122367]
MNVVYQEVWPIQIVQPMVEVFPVPVVHPVIIPNPAPVMFPVFDPSLYAQQSIKRVWIVSYSWPPVANGDPVARAVLEQHSPQTIEPKHTVHCEFWRPPPPAMCAEVSGISRRIQDWLRGHEPRARREVREAANIIIDQWCRGNNDVVIHTCCIAGTHRSVAAAEMISRKLQEKMARNGDANYSIVVNHAHRQRQPLDPY